MRKEWKEEIIEIVESVENTRRKGNKTVVTQVSIEADFGNEICAKIGKLGRM